LKSPHRTGRFRLPARGADPRAFAFGVCLGPRDQQLEAAGGLPGDVLDLNGAEFGPAQRTGR
jgi:hypothetical protein